jgi:hypothetical protein
MQMSIVGRAQGEKVEKVTHDIYIDIGGEGDGKREENKEEEE